MAGTADKAVQAVADTAHSCCFLGHAALGENDGAAEALKALLASGGTEWQMKVGDQVDVHYSDNKVETAEIISIADGIVTARMIARAGTVMVPTERLRLEGQDHWRIDF